MHGGGTIGSQDYTRRHKARHWFLSAPIMTSAMHFLGILLLGTSCMSLALYPMKKQDGCTQRESSIMTDSSMYAYI